MYLLALVAGVTFLPTVLWLLNEPKHRAAWPRRITRSLHVTAGAYRDADVDQQLEVPGSAPGIVHAASIGSWALGQMFFPGLAAGIVGTFVGGVGLLSIPGLILAWRLLFLGGPLLKGTPEAAANARAAATFTRVLNTVVLALASLVFVITLVRSYGYHSHRDEAAQILSALVALYACVSFVHAHLLVGAAAAIEARAKQSPEATPVRIADDSAVRIADATALIAAEMPPGFDAASAARSRHQG